MHKRNLWLMSLAAVTGCVSLPAAVEPGALGFRELSPGAVVTVVRIPPPWYAARFLVVSGFRKAVPQYRAVPGLERKQFTVATDGRFGGIYQWKDRGSAEGWFSPEWHERVRQRWGAEGEVRFIAVTRTLDGPAPPVEEGAMVAAIVPGELAAYLRARGLRQATEGEGKVVSVWHTRAAAEAFFAGEQGIEWYDAPVAIANPLR
jgi:hypothetical protein